MVKSSGRTWLGVGFPVSSRGGASGDLVVGSPEPALERKWSLIQALTQQTGTALAQTRLLDGERAFRAQIVDEGTTLRRHGHLVTAATPGAVFAAVAAEVRRLPLAGFTELLATAVEPGHVALVVGAWAVLPAPGRWLPVVHSACKRRWLEPIAVQNS